MPHSPLFDTIARQHRIWCDADPDGSAGGWNAAKVQLYADRNVIRQDEADEIIATGGHVGVLLMMTATDPTL